MRLLNANTYEFREFRAHESLPKYAILSHRWYTEEITFRLLSPSELRDDSLTKPALDKIRGTCRIAREDQLEWVWIDSCCINRESSEELNRSIRSMFKWYQEATVCYTYMSDVVAPGRGMATFKREGKQGGSDEEFSEWFSRGWCLQELLAPRTLMFFDKNWLPMGTRAHLATEIEKVTGIEARYLDGSETFRTASIATRLSWQARRKTTEEEDMAYSLLGILGVSLIPTYGDGPLAFIKLQQELIKNYRDESIFAWTAPAQHLPNHDRDWGRCEWGLLAPSVDCFQNSRDVLSNGRTMQSRPSGGIAPTAEGVKFPMLKGDLKWDPTWARSLAPILPPFLGPFLYHAFVVYRHKSRKERRLTLNCWKKDDLGEMKQIQVFICRDSRGDSFWRRCRCDKLELVRPRGGKKGPTKDITIIQPNRFR